MLWAFIAKSVLSAYWMSFNQSWRIFHECFISHQRHVQMSSIKLNNFVYQTDPINCREVYILTWVVDTKTVFNWSCLKCDPWRVSISIIKLNLHLFSRTLIATFLNWLFDVPSLVHQNNIWIAVDCPCSEVSLGTFTWPMLSIP